MDLIYYSPYYKDPQKGTPNFGKVPYIHMYRKALLFPWLAREVSVLQDESWRHRPEPQLSRIVGRGGLPVL